MENYENSSESSPVATTSRMVEMEASTSSTNVTLHERNCTPRPRCVYTAVNKVSDLNLWNFPFPMKFLVPNSSQKLIPAQRHSPQRRMHENERIRIL